MRSVLIIQTAFIGDVILATALVEQIQMEYPDVKIDFLLKKQWASLLKNNPHITQVYKLDKSKKKDLLRCIREVRKQKYDYVINCHRHFSSGFITTFSGARKKIGFKKNPWSFFWTKRYDHIMSKNGSPHETERNFALVSSFCKKPIQKPKLYPSEEDYEIVKTDKRFITISPASVWFTKEWPKDKWIELIKKLPEDIEVYLLGGKNDFDLCEGIKKECSGHVVHNKAGEYNFLLSAALKENAIMNYANDSAPLHIASAMNAPITGIFCSTSPAFGFGPVSDESCIMEYDGQLACRPCGSHGKKVCPEGHFKCVEIDVQKVAETTLIKL